MRNNIYLKTIKYFSIILISGLVLILIPIHTIDGNIFSNYLNPSKRNVINTIFLESFGFFTKNPKDEQLSLYYFDDNDILFPINLKNSSIKNNFGLSRISRRKILDLGRISNMVSDSLWHNTRSDSLLFLKFNETEVINFDFGKNKIISLEPRKYLVTKAKPIVWEWSKLKKNYILSYAIFEIKKPSPKN